MRFTYEEVAGWAQTIETQAQVNRVWLDEAARTFSDTDEAGGARVRVFSFSVEDGDLRKVDGKWCRFDGGKGEFVPSDAAVKAMFFKEILEGGDDGKV